MEDRETPRMSKYGESKTTRIMMATVRHVTSSSGLRKFQADGFFFDIGLRQFTSTSFPIHYSYLSTQIVSQLLLVLLNKPLTLMS